MRSRLFLVLFLLINFHLSAQNKTVVLVSQFQNQSGKEYDWFAAGLSNTVLNDLSYLNELEIVSEQSRHRAMQELQFALSDLADQDKLKEVGKFLSADLILDGSFAVFNNQIRIWASLSQVENSSTKASIKIDGSFSDDNIWELQDKVVIDIINEAARRGLKGFYGRKVLASEEKSIRDKATENNQAFKLYSRALQVKYTNPRQALDLFKQALVLDPDYEDALYEAGLICLSILDDFKSAENYFLKLLEKNKNAKATVKLAKIKQKLAKIAYKRSQFRKAIRLLREANKDYKASHSTSSINYAYFQEDTAELFLAFDFFDEALQHLEVCPA